MGVYTIEAPDGRRIKIEAPDEATAVKGAEEWVSANPRQAATEQPAFTPRQEELISDYLGRKRAGGTGALTAATRAGQSSSTLGLTDLLDRGLDYVETGVASNFGSDTWDDLYTARREAERRYQDELSRKNPVASAAGSLAGGLGLIGPLSGIKAAGAASAALPAPTGAAGAVARALAPAEGGVMQQVAKGAAQGGALGGIYAANTGQDIAEGAVTGAAAGGAVPAVASAVRGVYGVGRDVLSPYLRPQEFAAEKFAQASGGVDDAIRNTQRASKAGALPIDYAPEQARSLARAAVDVPNPGTGRTTTMMNARQLQQGDRVEGAVAKAFGSPDLYEKGLEGAVNKLKTAGNQNYRAAFDAKKPVNIQPVLDGIDSTIAPGVNKLVSPADTIADDSVSATLARVRRLLASDKDRMTDLENLHLVKMDLDGIIGTAKRGGNNTLASKLMGVKTDLLKAMESSNPLYQTARRTFAGDAAVKEAFETGRSYFATKGADISPREIAALSQAEREALKFGVAKGLQEVINGAQDGADVVKRIIGSKAKRALLDPLFESPKERSRFFSKMLVEARKYRTRMDVVGGSRTNRYLQAANEGNVASDVARDVVTGGLTGAMKAFVSRSLSRMKGLTPEVADEFLKIATAKNPQDVSRMMALLQQARGRQDRVDELMRAFRATAPGVGIAANQ